LENFISRTFSSCRSETLYLLKNDSPFSLFLTVEYYSAFKKEGNSDPSYNMDES